MQTERTSSEVHHGAKVLPGKPAIVHPRLRIDELAIFLRRSIPNGVRMEIRPPKRVTAAEDLVLPAFDGWVPGAEVVVRCAGICEDAFSVALLINGTQRSEQVAVTLGDNPEATGEPATGAVGRSFSVELATPLATLAPVSDSALQLSLLVKHPARTLPLTDLKLVPIAETGPLLASLDLCDTTDALLFGAPERRLFDLQNPEEGTWIGSGKWRLQLVATWQEATSARYGLDARPIQIMHRWQRHGDETDVVYEDPARRWGGIHGAGENGSQGSLLTTAELVLDTSCADIGNVPEEGRDIPLDLIVLHTLMFGVHTCVCAWHAELPLRLRDPRPLERRFQRLSAVGIDFGTSATVAALYHKGYRSLLRLGISRTGTDKPAENPTYLLIEDHERLWAEMAKTTSLESGETQDTRFPDLVRVVQGSHAAFAAMADVPSAVVGELKSLPERIVGLDQSPQLRDRERQRDFLLDEARVRVLIRAYAYLLSRAINRPGQDVYLHYWLAHPAKFDERAKGILEQELRRGILLGIPEGIRAEDVTVSMSATEPEAFAAEVCPELAAHPALEPLIEKFGEMRFAVFDFGGGTLDIACGRFRPATEQEQEEFGTSAVIETMQTGGDDHLGGDYLSHELTWLTHQSEHVLPEMEQKEVPMMRPPTVPPNNLVNKPHLYKRSLAARQNRVRFERDLGLERVKFGPGERLRSTPNMMAARLDGTEVRIDALASNLDSLHESLKEHLLLRIREGVKLMKSMLSITSFGDGQSFIDQGVVILLAGNSSRSQFVERALAEVLEIPDLKVWRPDSNQPFKQNVVLYEMPARTERGISIVGVTPKTAVSLGALKIANHEVHLVRRTQGFSYFLGDLRGFPPKFKALVPMGTRASDPSQLQNYIDFGKWDAKTPLRVCKEYEPSKMTSSDPRLVLVPSGLPPGAIGKLYVCVLAPDEVLLHLEIPDHEPVQNVVNLAKYMR